MCFKKLFKVKPWVTVYSKYTFAEAYNIFRGNIEMEVKIILQVKEKKNGTYRHRCFAIRAINDEIVQSLTLGFVIHKFPSIELADVIQKYGLSK